MSRRRNEFTKETKRQASGTIPKGASGALKILTDDKFFDTPKDISKIMEKLKEYSRKKYGADRQIIEEDIYKRLRE